MSPISRNADSCADKLCASFRHLLPAVVALGLAGCAGKTYVVLLPDDDGSVGKVVVSASEGSTLLQSANEGANVGGSAGKTFVVDRERLSRDFGAALAAAPKKPLTFLLYFESGGAALTPQSQAELPKVRAEISSRPAPDLSIVGHTDTLGDADANARLALKRAQLVAELLGKLEVKPERITVVSHGEKNLLVQTPDNTDEPRNRRVEITVR
jgi:outer membrane protein OmpA-like peptidoglycan-associated protein